MGKALYRKYRSKNLSEILGQPHITTTLERSVKNGTFSHAYLFTGPRGVGKTSVARILAYQINDLDYSETEASHLDIIEIDAASNRRIDEVRDLNEKVRIAPVSSKYKVYIIDEVHMLTKEAFNALLKTLEEPPEHAVFILATTESHKVPETISSRTQRFAFKPIDVKSIADHLQTIAKKERVDITDEAVDLIAHHGDGSFRDSISLLDQIRNVSSNITVEDVINSLGLASEELLAKFMDGINEQSVGLVNEAVQSAKLQGVNAPILASQISAKLRDDLINGQSANNGRLVKLLKDLSLVGAQPDNALALELCLFDYVLSFSNETVAQKTLAKEAEPVIQQMEVKTPAMKDLPKLPSGDMGDTQWKAVLQGLKAKHNTLYGIVRMAAPEYSSSEIVLKFQFPFHHKRVNESKNQKIIEQMIKDITGLHLSVNSVHESSFSEPVTSEGTDVPSSDDFININNIFDGAEVVES